jgi:hypothetical protein
MAKAKPPITQRAVIELHGFSSIDKKILEGADLYRRVMLKVDSKFESSDEQLRSAPLGEVLKWMLSAAIAGSDVTIEGLKAIVEPKSFVDQVIERGKLPEESAAKPKKRRLAKAS